MTIARKSKHFGKKDKNSGFPGSGPPTKGGPKFAGLGFSGGSQGKGSKGLSFIRGSEQNPTVKSDQPRVIYGDTDESEVAPSKPVRNNAKKADFETMFVDLSGKRRVPTEKSSVSPAAKPNLATYDPSAPTDIPIDSKPTSAPATTEEPEIDPNMKPELAALMLQAKRLATDPPKTQPQQPPKPSLLSLLGATNAPPKPQLFQNKPPARSFVTKPAAPQKPIDTVTTARPQPQEPPQYDVVTGLRPSRADIVRDTMLAGYQKNFKAASSTTASLGNFVPASSPMSGFVPASKPMQGFVAASKPMSGFVAASSQNTKKDNSNNRR